MERSASIPGVAYASGLNESPSSGVSWAAVIGGAFVTAAISLILLALGAGLGLSSVSVWSNAGERATTVGRAAIGWLIIAQILAGAFGGYVAGRLRTKWADVHTDEVYFRDTAHGLLVWAVSAVVTAGLLGSAAASMAGNAARAAARSEGGNAESSSTGPAGYYIDGLFRSDHPAPARTDAEVRGEATRIFATALRNGSLDAGDRAYLGRSIAAQTGIGESDAEQRVSQSFATVQSEIERARKGAAHLSLWIFIALLAGAFCASFAATIGGRQRDSVKARELAH